MADGNVFDSGEPLGHTVALIGSISDDVMVGHVVADRVPIAKPLTLNVWTDDPAAQACATGFSLGSLVGAYSRRKRAEAVAGFRLVVIFSSCSEKVSRCGHRHNRGPQFRLLLGSQIVVPPDRRIGNPKRKTESACHPEQRCRRSCPVPQSHKH